MKNMLKIFTIVLTGIMMFAFCGTAFAEENDAPAQSAFDLLYLTNDPEGKGGMINNMPKTENGLSMGASVAFGTGSVPVREGYTFAGWSLSGGKNNAADVVSSVTIGQSGLKSEQLSNGKVRYKVYACWTKATAPVETPVETPVTDSNTPNLASSAIDSESEIPLSAPQSDIPLGVPSTGECPAPI